MEFPKDEVEALSCLGGSRFRTRRSQSEFPRRGRAGERRCRPPRRHPAEERFPHDEPLHAVGHLMVVPYRKTAELESLGENEVLELWALAVHAQKLLPRDDKGARVQHRPQRDPAAPGWPKSHLHLHIVPRGRVIRISCPVPWAGPLLSEPVARALRRRLGRRLDDLDLVRARLCPRPRDRAAPRLGAARCFAGPRSPTSSSSAACRCSSSCTGCTSASRSWSGSTSPPRRRRSSR